MKYVLTGERKSSVWVIAEIDKMRPKWGWSSHLLETTIRAGSIENITAFLEPIINYSKAYLVNIHCQEKITGLVQGKWCLYWESDQMLRGSLKKKRNVSYTRFFLNNLKNDEQKQRSSISCPSRVQTCESCEIDSSSCRSPNSSVYVW